MQLSVLYMCVYTHIKYIFMHVHNICVCMYICIYISCCKTIFYFFRVFYYFFLLFYISTSQKICYNLAPFKDITLIPLLIRVIRSEDLAGIFSVCNSRIVVVRRPRA